MGRWMCDEWRREEGGAVECISERRWGGGRWLWVWGGEREGICLLAEVVECDGRVCEWSGVIFVRSKLSSENAF